MLQNNYNTTKHFSENWGFMVRFDVYLLLLVPFVVLSSSSCNNRSSERIQRRPLTTERIATRQRVNAVTEAATDSKSVTLLTLEHAIRQALTASPELEQMRRRVEAAAQQVKQAEAAYYPRLVLSQDFNATDNPVFGMMHIINQRRLEQNTNFNDPGWQHNFGTQLKTDVTLFDAGARSYGRRVALSRRQAQESELQAARNQLTGSVIETYYHWLQAMGFTQVAQRALDQALTNEGLGEARIQAEAALPSELMRLKSRTAQSKGNLVSAQISTRRFQAALERLLTRRIIPDEIPDPNSFAPTLAEQSMDANALTDKAIEKRPEIQAVLYLMEAAQNRVQSLESDYWPKVGAFAQYQLDSERVRDFDDSWMFGVQAGWPLFEGGLTRAQVRQAEAQLRELEARGVQLALDIVLEVQQAYLALEETKQKAVVAQERKNWSEKALAETRQQYKKEAVTVEALLQAELDWNQAETSYTSAIFEQRIAQSLLRQAIGDYADWIETNHQ